MRSFDHSIEQYRLKDGPVGSTDAMGKNGVFILPHPEKNNLIIACIVSDGRGWEHVSVSLLFVRFNKTVQRTPTWEEMCYVKDMFWEKNEVVVQYHPAKKDYVNNHPFVLHLWKPIDQDLPLPEPIMVGIPGMEIPT